MEEIKQLLAKGTNHPDNKEYEMKAAEQYLTEGLTKLAGNEKENIELHCELLLQRSLSFLLQNNLEKVEEDANSVISICKETNSTDDNITKAYSTAYYRLGQMQEMKGRLLPALQEYSKSAALCPNTEGQSAISRLFTEAGLPPISEDPIMAPFLKIAHHLLQEDELAESLAESLKHIRKQEFDAQVFSSIGGCRIYFATMQIYIDNPLILGICVQCLTVLAQKGSKDVWSGYPLLKMAFQKAVVNAPLFVLLVQLLQLTPPGLYEHMDKLDFIDPLCDGLTLDLSEGQIQGVMNLIFHLANKDDQIKQVHNEGITDICLKNRNPASFMLLSKLCLNYDACQLAIKEGCIEWALQLLDNTKTEGHLLLGAFIFLSQCLIKENNPNFDSAFAENVVTHISKSILSHTKEPELVSHGFSVITTCIPFAQSKIIELKLISASSVLLSVHNNDPKVASIIIEFLYRCCDVLGSDEVKKIRAVLPTAMKALSTHAANGRIVEYATALAIYLDHAQMNDLLEIAMTVCPKSELLKKMKLLVKK